MVGVTTIKEIPKVWEFEKFECRVTDETLLAETT